MPALKEIVSLRLAQIGKSPIEAAVEAGLKREFIRDIVEDRKTTVRASSLPDLARALKLDAKALADGELVPVDAPQADTLSPEERKLISKYRKLPEGFRRAIRALAGAEDPENKEQGGGQP